MLAELGWRWGLGVVLGWLALPLFVRLARQSRHASPAVYYRALVTALAMAAALMFAPALRGALGRAVELPLPLAAPKWGDAASITLVADWVTPIVGSRAEAWSSMPLAHALSVLGGLWLCLLGAGAVRSLASRWRFGAAYRGAAAASERVRVRAARVAADLGIATPEIRVADGIASAFTFGFFDPIVVLGSDAECANDDELDFVLRHELTHVRRGDTRASLWIELAQRGFTGHPCLAALRAEIRFAREAAVDEAAAGAQPLEYARFLLGLAEQVQSLRAPQASLVSMADTALERRIEMLMSKRERKRSRLGAAWLGLSGLVLGALVFVAPSSFGQDADAGDSQKTRVDGNLSVEQVEKVVFGKARPWLNCYDQLPTPRENLHMRLLFTIGENGTVQSNERVSVPEHPQLAPCFEAVLERLIFPAPSSGRVEVDMPVMLSPDYDERQAVAEAKEGVSQRLPPEVIRDVVREQYDRIQACYETLGTPLPTTTARLKFTIARDGKVSDGEVVCKEHPALAKCLDPVMRSLVFPPPKDGIVTVEYPIGFAPPK